MRIVTVERELAERVAALLGDYLGAGGSDDDEDRPGGPQGPDDTARSDPGAIDALAAPVAMQSGTALVLVRLVDADPPLVRVFSPLLRSIACSPELLVELNEINGHLSFLRLFWRDSTVFAATEVLAESLDATTLGHACDGVAELSDYYDERLHRRFGGELAYG